MARNQKVVPESHQALDALKYEIAAELGLPVGKNKPGFYGNADAVLHPEMPEQ